MKFFITGADVESGSERRLSIEADDKSAALIAAKNNGILVYDIELQSDPSLDSYVGLSQQVAWALDACPRSEVKTAAMIGVLGLLVCSFAWGLSNHFAKSWFSTNNPYASAPGYVKTDNYDDSERLEYLEELKAIEDDLNARQFSIEPADRDLSDVQKRLDPITEKAHSRVDEINREPWEKGYSLEVRREAVLRTLIEQGYTPHEARLTVDAMEQEGLLPDPPLP